MSDSGKNWPQGLSEEVAVIDVSIEHVEEVLGVEFYEDNDDLDYYIYHVFEFDNKYCALMRYKHAPIDGITLIVDEYVDVRYSIDFFIDMLKLSDRSILWRRDRDVDSGSSNLTQ